MEWSVPMWCANLDLRKLFIVLSTMRCLIFFWQGVPHAYLKLIGSMCHAQLVQASVLNPLFFHAGFEYAMTKWKLRVQHCGLHCGDDELLTNVRYADDSMLFARGDTDLAIMVEGVVEKLAVVRLRPPPARCVPPPLFHHWKMAMHFASTKFTHSPP